MSLLRNTQESYRLPTRKSRTSKVFMWSLFDIHKHQEPDLIFIRSPCLPVQTASPDPIRFKTWQKESRPICMGLAVMDARRARKGVCSYVACFYPGLSTDYSVYRITLVTSRFWMRFAKSPSNTKQIHYDCSQVLVRFWTSFKRSPQIRLLLV